MLSLVASSILMFACIAAVVRLWLRCWEAPESQSAAWHRWNRALHGKLCDLEALILVARRESERLEAAVRQTKTGELIVTGNTLANIECLAEAGALENAQALAGAARRIARLPDEVNSDLFQQNQKAVKVARLADQGHSAAEIARRLHLPIGEVELLQSLRST